MQSAKSSFKLLSPMRVSMPSPSSAPGEAWMPSTPVPSGNVALRVPADASNVRQRRHELEDGNRIGSEREEIAEHPPLVDRKWRGVCQHGSNRVRVAVDVGQQPESHDALPTPSGVPRADDCRAARA